MTTFICTYFLSVDYIEEQSLFFSLLVGIMFLITFLPFSHYSVAFFSVIFPLLPLTLNSTVIHLHTTRTYP